LELSKGLGLYVAPLTKLVVLRLLKQLAVVRIGKLTGNEERWEGGRGGRKS
jgi:hypothetical protein